MKAASPSPRGAPFESAREGSDPGGSGSTASSPDRTTPAGLKGLVRRLWERRKHSAVPPGALTFHLEAWTRRAISPAGADAAAAARVRLGFEELLVLHGSAWRDGEAVTVIVGPPGIGKSSALRQLQEDGRGRLVEEGLLLVGRRGSRWHLVLTGTLDLLARASRISRRIRNLMGVDFCLFQNAEIEVLRRAHPIRSAVLFRLSEISFTAAAAFGPRPREPFTLSSLEVRALVVMPHPQDSAAALRLRDGGPAEEVSDVASLAPEGIAVVSVSPLGNLEEVRRRLQQAVLAGSDPEPRGRPGS